MSSTQEVGEIFGDGVGPAQSMLRSPTVLIAGIGLWGMNIYFFKWFGLDYVKILKYDLLRIDKDTHKADEQQQQQQQQTTTTSHHNNHNGGNTTTTSSSSSSSSSTASTSSSSSTQSSSNGSMIAPTSKDIVMIEDVTNQNGSGAELSSLIVASSLDHDNHHHHHHDIMSGADIHSAITWERLVSFSLMLLVILHTTSYIWIDILGGGMIGSIFAFYGAVCIGIMIPLPKTAWLRKATIITLQRTYELINPRFQCHADFRKTTTTTAGSLNNNNPPRPIPFVDVFFADAMCSLSKVFFDWGMLWHMASYYPNPVPSNVMHIIIPSAFATVPFFIRARQCIVMYTVGRLKKDPKRFSHIYNAIKYSTSIFPLILSAYMKTVSTELAERLEVYLIALQCINALYALYWDIVMDWGMMQNPTAAAAVVCNAAAAGAPMIVSTTTSGSNNGTNSNGSTNSNGTSSGSGSNGGVSNGSNNNINGNNMDQGGNSKYNTYASHVMMRPTLRFGILMSSIIVCSDTILRFCWLLRFYERLFPSHDNYVLCTQFLEAFRRSIWNLLRVEWENIKQMKQQQKIIIQSSSSGSSGSGMGMGGISNGKGGVVMKEEEMTGLIHHGSSSSSMNKSAMMNGKKVNVA